MGISPTKSTIKILATMLTFQQITNLTPEELRIKCDDVDENSQHMPTLTLDTCRRREMEMSDEEYLQFTCFLNAWVEPTAKGPAYRQQAYLSADAITRSRAWLAARKSRRSQQWEN